MTEYTNKRFVGRNTTLSVSIQGVDNDPALATLLPLGAVTTKSYSIDGNVLEANDSFNASGFSENQLGSSSLSLSVSGNYVRDPDSFPNAEFIDALERHRFDKVKQDLSEDPVILVKYARPGNTLLAYMIINSISVDDPDSEYSTYTMELSLATSPTYPPTLTPTV